MTINFNYDLSKGQCQVEFGKIRSSFQNPLKNVHLVKLLPAFQNVIYFDNNQREQFLLTSDLPHFQALHSQKLRHCLEVL